MLPAGPLAQPSEHAGADEMRQRHPALRSASFALASVSSALAIRRSRRGATRRRASLTVSFKVLVPSSLFAAISALSSMSTRCLAMAGSISKSDPVYPAVGSEEVVPKRNRCRTLHPLASAPPVAPWLAASVFHSWRGLRPRLPLPGGGPRGGLRPPPADLTRDRHPRPAAPSRRDDAREAAPGRRRGGAGARRRPAGRPEGGGPAVSRDRAR